MPRPAPPRSVLSAVAQLTWGVALIAGLPLVLAAAFGWPLPTRVPNWDQVTSTPLRFVDPTVIVNVFVCLAWLCWISLTAYTVLGVIDTLRGIPRRQHRIGPLATLAGKIVASALMLASLTRPVAVAALPNPPPAAGVLIDSHPPLDSAATTVSGGGDTTTETPPAAEVTASDPVYVVQRGDTLWDIAEAQLGNAFRWTEIRDLNAQLIANPNLICSGWQLTLPRDAATTVTDAPTPAAPTPAITPPEVPQPEPPTSGALAPTTSTAVTFTTAPAGGRAEQPAPAEPQAVSSGPDAGAGTDAISSVAGLAGATVLATGLAVALRRRRRRRHAGPLPFSEVTEVERALVAAADLPLVRWAGQELARLGELRAGTRHPGVPVAVEFSDAAGIELLWDQPVMDAPVPWIVDPGGWSWRLPYDPSAPTPAAERPSVLPGLVTIGQRDGRQLLVNLEALGTVALVGDTAAADDLLRAMLTELAASNEIAEARVCVVDPRTELGLPDHLDIESLAVDDAVERLAAATSEAERLLDRVGCATSFAYRTFTTPVLPLEITVIAGSSHVAGLVGAARALPSHRAAVVLLLGETEGIENRITLGPDGTGTLEPLGIRFTPAALPATTGAAVSALLATASARVDGHLAGGGNGSVAPLDDDLRPWWLDSDHAAAATDLGPGTEADGPVRDDLEGAFEQFDLDLSDEVEELAVAIPAPRMMVKVLGSPRLVDGPAIGRRELVVVALVACSARRVTHEQVQDAIWGSSPVTPKTVFNLIGSARSALGSWDGEAVLSAATRPDNAIVLHSDVGTDLEVLRALVAGAELSPSTAAIGMLVDALELVEGPPFDAAGYDWAVTGQLVSEAEHLIERAAIMAAELAVEAGDFNRARWATVQGLRAVPGDEALYRLRMRIEDAAGNLSGVRRAFDELEAHLDEFDLSPSPATVDLLAGYGSASTRRVPATRVPSAGFLGSAQ
jgi:DNA-binding SARP family transcriptional activator